MDIPKGEQDQLPFREPNPNRVIPLRVDDDLVLSEAAAIFALSRDKGRLGDVSARAEAPRQG